MKRVLRILLVSLALLAFLNTAGAAPIDDYKRGNRYYEDRQFEKARAAYLAALHAGIEDSDLLYNLANATYKASPTRNLGKALLYTERASRLDPWDTDIQHNLAFLRDQVAMEAGEKKTAPWYRRFTAWYSQIQSETFLVFHFLFMTLFFAFLITKLLQGYSPLSRHRLNAPIVIAIIAVIGFTSVAWHRWDQDHSRRFGIVTDPTVPLRAGPGDDQTEIIQLTQGVKFQIVYQKDNWSQVSLVGHGSYQALDGVAGWIAANTYDPI